MSTEPLTPTSTLPETSATPPAQTTPSLINPTPPVAEPVVTPPVESAPWAEYVVDPAKTDAENAAAKAYHDATKPAEAPKKDEPAPVIAVTDIKLPEGFQPYTPQ
jgi:hypothetical protein